MEVIVMANTILHVGEQIPVQARFFDAAGKPAAIVGIPAWSTSDDTVVALKVLPDGTCLLLGVSADTDIDIQAVGTGFDGNVTLHLFVDVVTSFATNGVIVAGAEVSQAAQSPQ
jgi:hypothetical protein